MCWGDFKSVSSRLLTQFPTVELYSNGEKTDETLNRTVADEVVITGVLQSWTALSFHV